MSHHSASARSRARARARSERTDPTAIAPDRRRMMARAMTEDELLAGITEAATFLGWRWYHVRRSDSISMGHMGFPDLVLARAGRVLFLELKTETGKASADQHAWLEALAGGNAEHDRRTVQLVRPADYDRILELLK